MQPILLAVELGGSSRLDHPFYERAEVRERRLLASRFSLLATVNSSTARIVAHVAHQTHTPVHAFFFFGLNTFIMPRATTEPTIIAIKSG